jgi:hypothetical protein
MKSSTIVSAAALLLCWGSSAPALAQEQHEPEAKPAAHEEKAAPPQHERKARPVAHQEKAAPPPHEREARSAAHVEKAAPPQHEREARPTMTPQQQAEPAVRHGEPQGQRMTEQRRVQRTVWQSHRAQHWQTEHRDWRQRGGYHGYRIPRDRYRVYFGPTHVFPIYSVPMVVVGGEPRFQYQGFWFLVVDPWPEYWADDWYDTDDVYIDYLDDGYYLCDPRYPGVQLAVIVSR